MRGDGAGEDVNGDLPPLDEGIVGVDDGFDFPLPEGSFPGRTAPSEPWIGSAQVPPRDGGALSRKLPSDFFQVKTHHIAEDGRRGPTRGPQGQRARPPPLWMVGGPPLVLSSPNIFYLFQNDSP